MFGLGVAGSGIVFKKGYRLREVWSERPGFRGEIWRIAKMAMFNAK